MKYTYSIIVCSINPELAEKLHKNIETTIGCSFEMLICNNLGTDKGIGLVYNEAAARAEGEYICFVHEDVLFHTPNWGVSIATKLAERKTGVIGFAGANCKLSSISGWSANTTDVRQNYIQRYQSGHRHHFITNPNGVDFSPSICLDGFCMFVRREIWAENPFDTISFPGFHGYDLDFTTSIALHYNNYVCNTIEVEHISEGKFSKKWLDALNCYHEKHRAHLPLFAQWSPSVSQQAALERKCEAYFIKFKMKMGLYDGVEALKDIYRYICKYPGYFKSWGLIVKWIKYGRRRVSV